MSALELIQNTARSEHQIAHHAAARLMAQAIYAFVQEMLNSGEDKATVYEALRWLYDEACANDQSVDRDAFAEVLDEFDDLEPSDTNPVAV
jgi:hypothetical protein